MTMPVSRAMTVLLRLSDDNASVSSNDCATETQ